MAPDPWLLMSLTLGPAGAWQDMFSPDQLERGWSAYRDQVLEHKRAGSRPWAWWALDRHESPPEHDAEEVLKLIELAELAGEELEAVRQRAQEALRAAEWAEHLEHVGAVRTTPREEAERGRQRRERDVELWGRVLDALASRPPSG